MDFSEKILSATATTTLTLGLESLQCVYTDTVRRILEAAFLGGPERGKIIGL